MWNNIYSIPKVIISRGSFVASIFGAAHIYTMLYLKIGFIFQANRNCIAIASSHDVQELDVSGILTHRLYLGRWWCRSGNQRGTPFTFV